MALLPFTVAAPELAPWLIVISFLGLAAALRAFRRLALPALAALLIAAWPLMQIPTVEHKMATQLTAPAQRPPFVLLDCFRGIRTAAIEPELLPFNIHYYRPRAAGDRPGLIDIYGGAWQRGSPTDNQRFARYMASRGYAVFAIDYRHAPAWKFPAQMEDVRAAISFIHAHSRSYQTDPDRLVVCGRSAGAELALLAAYEPGPVPIAAAIGFYSPTDLTLGYADPPSPDPIHVRAVLEAYLGGAPAAFPERYRAASPVSYANRPLPPTLLIHGSRDHLVKPEFSRELYGRLIASGNRAVLLEIPWAEHAFDAVFSGIGSQLALHYLERFLAESLAPRHPKAG
ncbi:MAG: alpha/beta hydrolase [Acidobacteriia bacterium]|nr:alpha/beta hydrolase [Terriglobia bacterium]